MARPRRGHVRGYNFDAAEAVAIELDRLTDRLRPGETSPYATLIRAEALLRQKEPRQGPERHSTTCSTNTHECERPSHSGAAIAAVYRATETEQEILATLEKLSPGSALGHYEAGVNWPTGASTPPPWPT